MENVERFYRYDDITSRINCKDFAKQVLNIPKSKKGHFNIPWRPGSDSGALQINDTTWTDHTRSKGESHRSGNIIHLTALTKFNGDIQQAQQFLGDYLCLEPSVKVQKEFVFRGDVLIEDGYTITKRYDYTDIAGNVIHSVLRYEHPEHDKEFVQQAPGKKSLRGVKTVLYNLPAWHDHSWVAITEGEKDADNLAELGIPSTTNASGCGRWESHYNEYLAKKKVVIFEDNDDEGRKRSAFLAWELKDVASSIKVISLPDVPEKGDVSDWIATGKTQADVMKLIQDAKVLDKDNIPDPGAEYEMIQRAKEANQEDFANFTQHKNEEGQIIRRPKQILEIVHDIHRRFLMFPRRIGSTLFDHDRKTKDIEYINNSNRMIAWIGQKSKRHVKWGNFEGCMSKEVVFEALSGNAIKYEAISTVPDWPQRDDVYYSHSRLPSPSTNHVYFNELVDFFNPVSEHDRVMVKTLLTAPIFYNHKIPRPMWIIDSETPQSGKTTLANITADLYGAPPIEIRYRDLKRDTQEITKRLVSSTGRQSRVLLIDNITGTFASNELAAMVTAPNISGRPPYGKGEETRPNNLTYIITSNNATVNNDIAIHAYFVQLKSIKYFDPDWRSRLMDFMEKHRLQIFADIIDILNRHVRFEARAMTRFPEFETKILQAHCHDENHYQGIMENLKTIQADSNIEEEWGKQVEDVLRQSLTNMGFDPDVDAVWIRSDILKIWLEKVLVDVAPGSIIQQVRELARSGHCQMIDPVKKIWPSNGKNRRRGVGWNTHGLQKSSGGTHGCTLKSIGQFYDTVAVFNQDGSVYDKKSY